MENNSTCTLTLSYLLSRLDSMYFESSLLNLCFVCVSYCWGTRIPQFLRAWGPLPVETRGTAPPPKFSFGGPTMVPPPQILEVYNNSNLVNNEVFKKLTTKLASMKYHIMETLSDITC